jgi:branched-chain amino acid transport system permease protein
MLKRKEIKLILLALWAFLLAWPFWGIRRAAFIGSGFLILGMIYLIFQRLRRQAAYQRWEHKTGELFDKGSQGIKKLPRRNFYVLLLAFLLTFPFYTNNYFVDVATVTGLYIVLALGLNLVVGLTGLLHLGYVAFYAAGAYTYALLSTQAHISFWPSLLLGALVAAAFGLLLGLPTLRLRGDYLAIATLGFGEMTRIVLNNWTSATGGPNGILGIRPPAFTVGAPKFWGEIAGLQNLLSYLPNPEVLTSKITYFYYLIFLIAILTIFAVGRLDRSRIGRAWVAIREDEVAASCMGINTFAMKLLAFALGGAWAGLAGVFFAAKMGHISPESFTFFESVVILCMVVLGGMGSIPGVILGAVVFMVLPEVLREFQNYRMLIFGGAMVLMMVFRPQGFLGGLQRKMELSPEHQQNLRHEP